MESPAAEPRKRTLDAGVEANKCHKSATAICCAEHRHQMASGHNVSEGQWLRSHWRQNSQLSNSAFANSRALGASMQTTLNMCPSYPSCFWLRMCLLLLSQIIFALYLQFWACPLTMKSCHALNFFQYHGKCWFKQFSSTSFQKT